MAHPKHIFGHDDINPSALIVLIVCVVGHYWLQSSPGYAVNMFCDMERVCGCSVGLDNEDVLFEKVELYVQ